MHLGPHTQLLAGKRGRWREKVVGGRHSGHLVYIYGKGLEHKAEGKHGPRGQKDEHRVSVSRVWVALVGGKERRKYRAA